MNGIETMDPSDYPDIQSVVFIPKFTMNKQTDVGK